MHKNTGVMLLPDLNADVMLLPYLIPPVANGGGCQVCRDHLP